MSPYVVLAIALLGLAGTGVFADARGDASTVRAITATCTDGLREEADPHWRGRSTRAWRLGVYGPGRDFRDAERFPGSALLTKIPLIVEGTEGFTLKVPGSELGNVGLSYGPTSGARRIKEAATRVTFEPCAALDATAWVGGFLLKDRDPVRLKVERGSGDVKAIRVGRLPRRQVN